MARQWYGLVAHTQRTQRTHSVARHMELNANEEWKKVVQNGRKKRMENNCVLCGMWTTQRIAMTNLHNTKKQYVDDGVFFLFWMKENDCFI